jgi:hypothetical protein
MPRIDLFDVTMQSWARLNPPQRKRFSMRARRRRCVSAGLSSPWGSSGAHQRRGAAFLTQKLFKRKRPQIITSGAANSNGEVLLRGGRGL